MIGFVPLGEIGVGRVRRNGVVLDLAVLWVDSGVENDGFVAGKNGGGAGPTAIDIEGFGRVNGVFESFPID